MKRQWYYRGSLKFCNYKCSYCPFSKRKGSKAMLLEDQVALFRFVEAFNRRESAEGALQIIPYGEALIHPYYWEGLALLSQNVRLDAVGAQSNFSFPVEQMLSVYEGHGGDFGKLRLWGTFHPEMTSVEQFVSQCEKLSAHGISYCVGAVGDPSQIHTISMLRDSLPSGVYMWINKMDGLGRNYTQAEIAAFLEIDAYFEMELAHYKADVKLCGDNRFVEADGEMHHCNLCRQSVGNFYEDLGQGLERNRTYVLECKRKECSCYLSYCNRKEEQLLFFQPYPAFRIPFYPRAVFIDVDGTLIPEGERHVPERYERWVKRLAAHCDIYLATSLPYEVARKKVKSVWQMLRGGVFANGGRWVVWDGQQGDLACMEDSHEDRCVVVDEIEPLDVSWLPWVEQKEMNGIEPLCGRCLPKKRQNISEYGFRLHIYQSKGVAYKATLVCRRGRLSEICAEGYLDRIREMFCIPPSCQLMREEHCIQVTKRGTGKLEGILNICGNMGYAEEEVAVIGNSENDIPMLKHFPFSVAARGSDESVKACAKIIL